ncbi:hypothetical protein BT93_D2160 [Corymbia citriodora subsp. variegata]|nr:hypothetical protein BT93_D2160 [Corymbia citriodora subsp. variegata]
MATPLAPLAKLHGPKSPLSGGQNKPIKRSKVRHCLEKDASHHHYPAECMELHGDAASGEKKRRSRRRQAQELPWLLGFGYLESSMRYILMKAKAFFNEFCCDAFEDSLVVKNDAVVSVVDPYFSIPVTPPPSVSP